MEKQFDYAAFDRATGYMTAFAILRNGEPIGRVVIKPGRDGASRLTAYAQVWGAPMVKGTASGFGYDKRGAALSQALQRLVGDDDCAATVILRDIGRKHDQFESIRSAIETAGYRIVNVI